MDGTSDFDGRLEICQVGVWGTICNAWWDRNDAIVACRQLGINATGMSALLLIILLIMIYFCHNTSCLCGITLKRNWPHPVVWIIVPWH